MTRAARLDDAIDEALPQTQCTRCGFPDCRGYASAIAESAAPINQCPPGGERGVMHLASITGQPAQRLNPANGVEGPRRLAVIDEAWCIGCTLCIKACPVDCIVGSPKLMHTVVADQCTGCELCIPACPVDCISLQPVTGNRTGWDAWSVRQAAQARQRYAFRQLRMEREQAEQTGRLAGTTLPKEDRPNIDVPPGRQADSAKSAAIEAVLARARARACAEAAKSPLEPEAATHARNCGS